MYLQIGKDKIDISEITSHYIHSTFPVPGKICSSLGYSESSIAPKHITDEVFNDIRYALFSRTIFWSPAGLLPKEQDKMEYFTFKCNDKKLQKYLNLNKKIMGDNKDTKTLLLPSTKEGYKSVDLYGYYILFDKELQLYKCKMDYFVENFYN